MDSRTRRRSFKSGFPILKSAPGLTYSIKITARRDGDQYVINGSKTFTTNGWHAILVCLVVKTDIKASGVKGMSVIIVKA